MAHISAINCAALPANLIENELFGHEKGSFTGAEEARQGCFELARNGTLLLDEFTEMRPELQAKLLRVIEERKLRRVGGNREIPLDVRVLAASNCNIGQALSEGRLREDLYYRLSVFNITVPPLRERADDIAVLTQSFIARFAAESHRPITGADEECLIALQAHSWPGNIRQLRNVIQRAVALSPGPHLGRADLPAEFQHRAILRRFISGPRRRHPGGGGTGSDCAHDRGLQGQQDSRRQGTWNQPEDAL